MEKGHKILREWVLNYIKSRDVLVRHIESIEENKQGWDIIVKTKSGEKYYLIIPSLKDFGNIWKKFENKDVVAVAFNTRENLSFLAENWENASLHKGLSFIFANPKSELEKKWIIFPHTHDTVTERKSLQKGLNALFQTVDEWHG